MADEVRRVPVQIASKVCGEFDNILAESRQASGLFWCRWLMRFRKVLAHGGEVADGSGADSRQSC